MPLAVPVLFALVTVVFFQRDSGRSRERWGRAFEAWRHAERIEVAGVGYRAHRVVAWDAHAPLWLALASRATAWWVVQGLVRVGALVAEIPNLTDEPHRRVGLVPDGPSLVLVHGGLGFLVFGAIVGALRLRGRLARLERDPNEATTNLRAAFGVAIATSVVAASGGVVACVAVVVQTPMNLYWLRNMAGSSAVYALCGWVVVGVLLRASKAIRGRHVGG
ncbi:MAG: hypothetical protein H6722_11890 [Sandaracinus sp.]|nr:hypothetical protein [Sandaracinus sp.]MCB9625066.1 hypothetical protein [Sandaracinus sp.]